MGKMSKKKSKIFTYLFSKKMIFFVFLLFIFLLSAFSSVQAIDLGEANVSGLGLGATDPRVILARIIQIALGFLGILSVALIMYGGFLWMTSSGSEEQISRAKKILINAIIGLIIILASFGIVTFVLSKIKEATNINGSNTNPSASSSIGTGVLGNCLVEVVYPEDGQREVPRNTSIMITFKEAVDPASVCNDGGDGDCDGDPVRDDGRIRLYKTSDGEDGYLTNINVSNTPDRKTFIFVPGEYLGSPSERLWYTMNFSNDITLLDGSGVFDNCRNSYLEWRFEVSNRLDLVPPQILKKGVSPSPDNERDSATTISSASRAKDSITILNNSGINIYSPASLISSIGPNIDTVVVAPESSQGGALILRVQTDGIKVQMSRGGTLLGAADFNGRTVNFKNILSLTLSADPVAGNEWTINISSRVAPDTITIGQDVYTFVAVASAANQIIKGANANATVANIALAINSTRTDINASANANVVTVEAVAAGKRGNDLEFSASAPVSILSISHLQEGGDQVDNITVNDRKDQPMNTAIQITFNEPIMPLFVSGDATNVRNYIRIVNGDVAAKSSGNSCAIDAECISFNCEAGSCAGTNDYLPGTFRISNMYKTVEFVSDNQCGINGCGEAIYCLPENSILKVEIEAASLDGCSNCSSKSPYNTCVDGSCANDISGNYTNSRVRKYPLADMGVMDGVMDASFNSFDGNRNGYSEGSEYFWNDNTPVYSTDSQCQADFEEIIAAIVAERKDKNNLLGEITGTFDSAIPCASPNSAACLAAQRSVFQKLGFADAKHDQNGNLFIIDENEDQPSLGACAPDTVSSVLCGSVDAPMFFCVQGDNSQWSFYINDKMEINPPVIESLSPAKNVGTNLASPVLVVFDKLMMSSTLKTGGTIIADGEGSLISHRNVNIWSLSGVVPGYWITNEILLDDNGLPKKTQASINHSLFAESVTYRAQVGSGVKDIYQNCFKPSNGPDCAPTASKPSCCNGSAVDSLDANGNCP